MKRFWVVCLCCAWILAGLIPTRTVQAQGPTDPVRYAKTSAAGSGDCSSWANACTLQTALNGALPGQQVWAAAGVHYPGNSASSTFTLKDGVGVYGGFAGNETSLNQRNVAANRTTLSCDIGIVGLSADNCLHVVTASSVGISTLLDGFTITGGNAVGAHPTGSGGGVYLDNASLTLQNLVIRGNWANTGGGLYSGNNSGPTLNHVTFEDNYAQNAGGGMYTIWGGSTGLYNVLFYMNQTSGDGGGLYSEITTIQLQNVTFQANVSDVEQNNIGSGGGMYSKKNYSTLSGVTFYGNQSNANGGGLYLSTANIAMENVTLVQNRAVGSGGNGMGGGIVFESSPGGSLRHVTLWNNSAAAAGGGIFTQNSSPNVRNSLIWGNTSPLGAQIYEPNGSISVQFSVVQDDFPGGLFIYTDDPLVGTFGNHGGSTQTLSILPGSSALDRGSSTFCGDNDQRGHPRPQEGTNDGVADCDIGAFELDNLAPVVDLDNTVTSLVEETSIDSPLKVARAVITDDGIGIQSLSLSGEDAAMFSLSGEEVFLKAGAILDYETNPVLDVQVNVDDPTTAASPDDSEALSITVEDVVEDFTAPTVEGITRLDANPNLTPTARFAVQFSEPVKDVGAADFSVMTTDTLAAAVSGVTGSGSSYEVTVDCTSGDGTLRLDIPTSAQISDLAGNALSGLPYEDGEPYEIVRSRPFILWPRDGITLQNNRPELDWSDFDGALGYDVQISRSANFKKLLMSKRVIPAVSALIPKASLPANQHLYWRVRARTAAGAGPWSAAAEFVTANPPSTPVLQVPKNNQLITELRPRLDWRDSRVPLGTEFLKYEVQYADNAAFTGAVTLETAGLGPSETVLSEDLQPNTRYYWRVRAWNTAGESSVWSAVRSFRAAMTAPELSKPADGADTHTRRPMFEWLPVDGAAGYTVQVSKTDDFAKVMSSYTLKTAQNWFTPGSDLPANGTFFWRVRANGANGPSLFSAVRSFTTGQPPSVPALKSPAAGALVREVRPRLDWSTVVLLPGTTFGYYQLELDQDAAFSAPLRAHVNQMAASEYTLEVDLEPNRTYYWRVRAWNAGVNGIAEDGDDDFSAWSKTRSFRTALAQPVLLSPGPGEVTASLQPLLDWQDSEGALGYRVEISRSDQFASLVRGVTVVNGVSEYTPPTALPSGTQLWWRVRATGKNGPSLWSETGTFFTP
ncbi:glycoside hydrolase family 78 protein [Levilinea saccharolytica]|uniref:Uncharacterized protein n=1 Tax=Levilinea saccharolytica TaxID=229921 RepID=A0A0P6XKH3_9CHLR|nr:choice-of-anchor Q domain-containing protein [Levilinea saccharolytica]KPL80720.1 hypothetical protein ADN01_11380 [Levilinea saccharolytica]GAP17207.1 protein containing fibronectin type III domain [Levilinea saccharolytica]